MTPISGYLTSSQLKFETYGKTPVLLSIVFLQGADLKMTTMNTRHGSNSSKKVNYLYIVHGV